MGLSTSDRFWSKVDKSGGPDSCWPWLLCCDGRGYGMFSLPRGNTKMIRSNRMALILYLDRELTDKEEACHSCDNPTCCNPSHLFVGTHRDNMEDYGSKHFAKGSRHAQAKLSPKQILWAKDQWRSGVTQKAIAEVLGVHKSHISRVVRGLTGHEFLENINED